ncbi:Mitogen-activated protein kinase kinase kinase 1b, partial [Bulinus truncatus]
MSHTNVNFLTTLSLTTPSGSTRVTNSLVGSSRIATLSGVKFPKTWIKGIHLGAGSFGKVYLVVDQDRPEDELFVVKEIQLAQNNKSKYLVDFKKETEILFVLRDHHRIVPYFGYSITDIAASIFMGYMKQGSLSLYSKANKLSEEDCFVFIQQILEGLDYLHKQNVIHRDVKGANILLETNTSIRLTDFGVSKVVSDITDKHTLEVGSWRWMAPEVCNEELNDESYSFEADSWSLGCTAIEMITGDHPYRSFKNTTSVILKVGNGEPPDLPDCISELSMNEYPERSEISQCTTSLQDIQCTNNPGHSSFTSIQTLTALHLSEHNLPDEVFQFIKSIVELTVQINVHSTSLNRPDHWPDSSYSYPYYNMRGGAETRSGSGMVYSVTLHADNNDKCPCQKCFMSEEPSKLWGIIDIMTATHVVFDVEEAKKSQCRFFFDDVNSEEIIINGFRLVTADVNKNWSLLRCITCDDKILKRVNREMLNFDSFLQNCNDNLPTECNSYGFIVSHLHGGPKQVSFGKMETRKILDQTWSQLTYTMSTCPGSSGAYVYIVGESGNVWHYPHVHSGAFSSGLNYSSVGYYETKEFKKATDNFEFQKDDMTFQSIATPWGIGEVLWRGKFSRVYPLIDLCQISKQFIIIKEEILPEDSIKCQKIL